MQNFDVMEVVPEQTVQTVKTIELEKNMAIQTGSDEAKLKAVTNNDDQTLNMLNTPTKPMDSVEPNVNTTDKTKSQT